MSLNSRFEFAIQAKSNKRQTIEIDGRVIDELTVLREAKEKITLSAKTDQDKLDVKSRARNILSILDQGEFPDADGWRFIQQLLLAIGESNGKKLDLAKIGHPKKPKRGQGRPSTIGLPPEETGGKPTVGYQVSERVFQLINAQSITPHKAIEAVSEELGKDIRDVRRYWSENKSYFDESAALERIKETFGHSSLIVKQVENHIQDKHLAKKMELSVQRLLKSGDTVVVNVELSGDYPYTLAFSFPRKHDIAGRSTQKNRESLIHIIYSGLINPNREEMALELFKIAVPTEDVIHKIVDIVLEVSKNSSLLRGTKHQK